MMTLLNLIVLDDHRIDEVTRALQQWCMITGSDMNANDAQRATCVAIASAQNGMETSTDILAAIGRAVFPESIKIGDTR